MSRNLKKTGLTVIGSGVAVVLAGIVGVFVYVNATVRPLHPDAAAIPSVTNATPGPAWTKAVDQGRQIARAALVAQNLPGLSIAVGVGGEIVWAEGFGWADLETRAPVTPHLRFRTGGVSIALTSAAAGLLIEKDRLKLDHDIQEYVPAFPAKQWPVTLRQVMGHVAGVRQDNGDEEPLSDRCERTVDALKRFAESPLSFEPESRYRYSTYGWILVSAAIESAAAEPFFTFMRGQVFQPIGMADTVPDSASEPVPDRATFYYPRFAADTRYGPEDARPGDYSCFAGAGAFLSTPSDLVRFAMAMRDGKLLQRETVRLLQSPQRLASGDETGYGLGWDLETMSLWGESIRMVGHDSESMIGGTASLMTFPDRGLVVAVMTNISFAEAGALASKVAAAFSPQLKGSTPK